MRLLIYFVIMIVLVNCQTGHPHCRQVCANNVDDDNYSRCLDRCDPSVNLYN